MNHRLRTGFPPYCDRLLVDDIGKDMYDIKNSDLRCNKLMNPWMKIALSQYRQKVSALGHWMGVGFVSLLAFGFCPEASSKTTTK